jgi:hypothetical protein
MEISGVIQIGQQHTANIVYPEGPVGQESIVQDNDNI